MKKSLASAKSPSQSSWVRESTGYGNVSSYGKIFFQVWIIFLCSSLAINTALLIPIIESLSCAIFCDLEHNYENSDGIVWWGGSGSNAINGDPSIPYKYIRLFDTLIFFNSSFLLSSAAYAPG